MNLEYNSKGSNENIPFRNYDFSQAEKPSDKLKKTI